MASHHHHHHQQQNTVANCCCCSSCSQYSTLFNNPSPSPPSADPLLQVLVSHLLQQQQQHQEGSFYQHHQQQQTQKAQQAHQFHRQKKQIHHQEQPGFVLSSLLSRIDALETSLHNFSSSSSSSTTYNRYSSSSLRNTAARVIQTHFRAFLVRRSRTLSHLKDLAIIKSSLNSLKLSISKKPHFDFEVASQKAMDLLLKLDSVQGGDPMIRDGKRSIRMDLVKFLEFIDGFVVRRREISCKASKNARFVGNGNKSKVDREKLEKLEKRVEKLQGFLRVSKGNDDDEDVELEGFNLDDAGEEDNENPRVFKNGKGVVVKRHVIAQPNSRVKKSVSFAENGNVYKVYGIGSSNGSTSSGDGSVSSDDNNGNVAEENHCSEVEEIKGLSKETENGEEVYLENGESSQSSDGERNPRRSSSSSLRGTGRNEINVDDEHFLFSAPLPAKMESRADLMSRKAVKIVT